MTTKKPQAKLVPKQAKSLPAVGVTTSTGVTSKQVSKPVPGKPSAKVEVKTTETVVKKVEVKPVTKAAAKPAMKVAEKKKVNKPAMTHVRSTPATKLVQTSELLSRAMHAGDTAPWDTQPTASSLPVAMLNQEAEPVAKDVVQRRSYEKPATTEPALQRRAYDKPVPVKAPVSPTQGLSMSEIRSNIARAAAGTVTFPGAPATFDRRVNAPYLRVEPVKTEGGISVKDVLRHIAHGFGVGQHR